MNRCIRRPGNALLSLVIACLTSMMLSARSNAGQLDYLDHPCDPYYVSRTFPKLTTPQWFGEDGVDCVVVLAIDDMRDTAHYEAYLRPILDRLKAIDGRAPVSIMSCSVNPDDPQLQSWLREGLSIEVHTVDHPCPLLQGGDLDKARRTVERCIDMMARVPGNHPVAYRMPCCDSLNTPSPRFWQEIFAKTTPEGNFLAIDSSVFQITTAADNELPKHLVTDADGGSRFRKYLPFPSFVNTIEDYPYPYVIGQVCWEFPCAVPSDWEAQNLHQPFNPKTVEDWNALLDAAVMKQGVVNIVFHPHGWIRNEQVVQWIDYANRQYGKRVKFITFREALDQLNANLLEGFPLRNSDGSPRGVRLLDLNSDGYLDVVIPADDEHTITRVWEPNDQRWHRVVEPFQFRKPRFGKLAKDGPVVMLETAEREDGWHARVWRGDHWDEMTWEMDTAGLDPVWQSLPSGLQDVAGCRFRDLDGDGCDEWLVCRKEGHALFRWDAEQRQWEPLPYSLPEDTRLTTDDDGDAGLRFVDLNGDGRDDIVFSDGSRYSVHLYQSEADGWSRTTLSGRRAAEAVAPLSPNQGPQQQVPQTPEAERPRDQQPTVPMIVRPDGSNNGAWFHSGHMWVQNEDTNRLPDLVDRLAFRDMIKSHQGNASTNQFPPPLAPAEALGRFEMAPGVRIELVAAEPLVQDPVAFDWGIDGELWVVEMRDYPSGVDGQGRVGGRVKRLTDTDGDGSYDHASVFLDDLPYPNGIAWWRDGVLVSAAPDVLYAEDTDGDGRADICESLFTGFGEGNQQHRANGFCFGLDHWMYMANGDSGGTVLSRKTGESLALRGADLRISPEDGRMELVAGQTQFGRSRDDAGNWFGGNNSAPVWHFVLDNAYIRRNPHYSPPTMHREISQQPGAATVFPASPLLPRFNDFDRANRFTSACSPMIYRDRQLGDPLAIYSFVCEPVHNLVHREQLQRHGASFTSHRVLGEETSEFLASQDNWFRPVMVRTGPEGGVWLADMYRLVIEHPEWIPRTWQEKLDLRAGSDRGRIYRVVPTGSSAPAVPTALRSKSTAELVTALEHDNGWVRDTAQQLLAWHKDPSSHAGLKRLLRQSTSRWAPLHAMYVLQEMGALSRDDLLHVISNGSTDAARHAIRLSEPVANSDQRFIDAIRQRLGRSENDLILVQQMAYSLGEYPAGEAAPLMAEILGRFDDEPLIRAAVYSSVNPGNVDSLLASVRERLQEPTKGTAIVSGESMAALYGFAVAMGSDETVRRTVQEFLADWEELEIVVASNILNEMARALGRTGREGVWNTEPVRQRLVAVVQRAEQVMLNADVDMAARVAAVRVVALADRAGAADVSVLHELLKPQVAPELQNAAVEALAQFSGEQTARLLLNGWTSYSPRVRDRVLQALLADQVMTRVLLEELLADRVDARTLGVRAQQALLRHSRRDVQELAERAFGGTTESDRQRVVDQYQSALELTADVERGRQVFRQRCATCHAFDGTGHHVGPDLSALTDKTAPSLLVAMLDPNRAVEERYVEYSVELTDGRQLGGLLVAESATGVTILAAEGVQHTILRSEIEAMHALPRSLMPEGFERDMSPQDMADVIGLLQTKPVPAKSFAGNTPQTAPVRDDGSIRLFAIHARVYGPTLVFEQPYRNLGYWESAQDYAAWDVDVPQSGQYRVTLHYACHAATAGNEFELSLAGKRLTGIVEGTGTWNDYVYRSVGTLELPAGPCEAVFRSHGAVQGHLLDLGAIILEPVD